MKHYGIWIPGVNKWVTSGDGLIFWTTSKAVAEEQLKRFSWYDTHPEVKEFIDEDS